MAVQRNLVFDNVGESLKEKINECNEQARKRDLSSKFWEYNSAVRKSTKKDKKESINALTTEAETAAGQCNMKRLYEKTRTMSGKRN